MAGHAVNRDIKFDPVSRGSINADRALYVSNGVTFDIQVWENAERTEYFVDDPRMEIEAIRLDVAEVLERRDKASKRGDELFTPNNGSTAASGNLEPKPSEPPSDIQMKGDYAFTAPSTEQIEDATETSSANSEVESVAGMWDSGEVADADSHPNFSVCISILDAPEDTSYRVHFVIDPPIPKSTSSKPDEYEIKVDDPRLAGIQEATAVNLTISVNHAEAGVTAKVGDIEKETPYTTFDDWVNGGTVKLTVARASWSEDGHYTIKGDYDLLV